MAGFDLYATDFALSVRMGSHIHLGLISGIEIEFEILASLIHATDRIAE